MPHPVRAALAFALVAACSAPEPQGFAAEKSGPASSQATMSPMGIVTNGIATNGIATNGIATNGIATNGLVLSAYSTSGNVSSGLADSGLTQTALASPAFAAWFALSPTYGNMVMTYLVRCAVASGSARTYAGPTGNYSWPGNFGLAPSWTSGHAIPVAEQQLVSACLAAHVNAYGQHVEISVRGQKADGSAIPVDPGEVSGFTAEEGCFFGNLFDQTGVASGYTPGYFQTGGKTSFRACAQTFAGSPSCAPLYVTATSCSALCTTFQADSGGSVWGTCTWNGETYRAITTRLQPSSVFQCGDGVCQATESCFHYKSGAPRWGCAADCGYCN